MTNIGSLVLILVCVGIGYVLEPIFFSGSSKSPVSDPPAEAAEVDVAGDLSEAEGRAPTPEAGEATGETDAGLPEEMGEMEVDWSKVIEADYPEKITLKVAYTLTDEASGVTMQLKEGSKVQPIRIQEDRIVFRPVGLPIEGETAISNTDFKQLTVPRMLERLQNAVDDATKMADAQGAEPAGDGGMVDDSLQEPPVPDPVPEPIEPIEPRGNEANEAAVVLDADAIVALMKSSVAKGQVSEFEATQVTSWKAGEAMDFDGKRYQTGWLTFKAETILGMQEHDAIALIENGVVVKWMWAKTKLEMR